MNLKEKISKKMLEIESSHTFETKKNNLVGLWFDGVEGEALSLILKDSEIEATTESPCLKEYDKTSGLTREQAHASIAIKWNEDFSDEDIKKIFKETKRGVKRLREISGWKK